MNYYILDTISKDDFDCVWGHKNNKTVEIFYFSADDTESELTNKGFAKCDAPDWNETMLIEETAWSYLINE